MKLVDILLAEYGSAALILPDGSSISLVKQPESAPRRNQRVVSKNKVKRVMSAATKRKIARAQKKRWKALRDG